MVQNGIQSQYTRDNGALKLRNKNWWMENCSNETLDLGMSLAASTLQVSR